MNYRHLYHAGNFADVFKHCILIMLVEFLHKKEKPFCYLDTHAGIGRYDLTSDIAQKTREYENGIARIYNQFNEHAVIKTYQRIVAEVNIPLANRISGLAPIDPSSLNLGNTRLQRAPGVYGVIHEEYEQKQQRSINSKCEGYKSPILHFYPGSPEIVHLLLRPQDSMILTELHQKDIVILKLHFAHDKRVAVHHADGYQSLKAFLPPKQGRGLILIDPPFEQPNEFQQIIAALQNALQRYPIGIYMIWYPIKDKLQVKNFHKELQKLNCKNILTVELAINKNTNIDTGLTSCGIVIINTPWGLQQQLAPVISWLSEKLVEHEKLDSTITQLT